MTPQPTGTFEDWMRSPVIQNHFHSGHEITLEMAYHAGAAEMQAENERLREALELVRCILLDAYLFKGNPRTILNKPATRMALESARDAIALAPRPPKET